MSYCGCFCHGNVLSSRAYCPHCNGDNEIGRFHAMKWAYERLEEIRRDLPYPRDYKGMKVEGGEHSFPPSTVKWLEEMVGTRVQPSPVMERLRRAVENG